MLFFKNPMSQRHLIFSSLTRFIDDVQDKSWTPPQIFILRTGKNLTNF